MGTWVGVSDGTTWTVSVGCVEAVGAWVAGEVGGCVCNEGVAGWLQAEKKTNRLQDSRHIRLEITFANIGTVQRIRIKSKPQPLAELTKNRKP